MNAERRIRNRCVVRRAATVRSVLLAILSAGPMALTAQQIDVSPQPIVVKAEKDGSQPTLTFYLTVSQPIQLLELRAENLEPVEGSRRTVRSLQASQIAFSPAKLENLTVGAEYPVTVSVTDLKRAGRWTGKVVMRWTLSAGDGIPASRGTTSIDLEVEYWVRPALKAAVPTKVIVHRAKGEEELERYVRIQETAEGSAATDLEYYVEPLLTGDQAKTLPAETVKVADGAPEEVTGSGSAVIPLTVDLTDAKAGEYSGQLVVTSTAPELKIPVEIKVRHARGWAFLVLVLGVGLSMFIPKYRTLIRPKDELWERIGKIEENLISDQEFAFHCGEKVRYHVTLAIERMGKNEIAQAKASVEAAETLWEQWSANRPELLRHIEVIRSLRAQTEAEPGFADLPSIEALRREIDDVLAHEIPRYVEAPSGLRDRVEETQGGWRTTIANGLALFRLLRGLKGRLGEEDEKRRQAIEDELVRLDRATAVDFRRLREAAEALGGRGEAFGKTEPTDSVDETVAVTDGSTNMARRALAAAARNRLRFFRIASFVLALILLVAVGFDELYLDNLTFGADFVSDYLGLFLWGFGAEAGRAQVVSLIKGWGVPI